MSLRVSFAAINKAKGLPAYTYKQTKTLDYVIDNGGSHLFVFYTADTHYPALTGIFADTFNDAYAEFICSPQFTRDYAISMDRDQWYVNDLVPVEYRTDPEQASDEDLWAWYSAQDAGVSGLEVNDNGDLVQTELVDAIIPRSYNG